MEKGKGVKVLAQNRKARHDYFIEETFEAGIVISKYAFLIGQIHSNYTGMLKHAVVSATSKMCHIAIYCIMRHLQYNLGNRI